MTPEEFRKWRKELGFNQTKAAKKLGLKLRTVQYYEKGERKGKKVEIPKTVSLACFALSCGVTDVDYSTPLGQPVQDHEKKYTLTSVGKALGNDTGN